MSAPIARGRRAVAAAVGLLVLASTGAACSGTESDSDSPPDGTKATFEMTVDTPEPSGDIDAFTWSPMPSRLASPTVTPSTTRTTWCCPTSARACCVGRRICRMSPGLAEKATSIADPDHLVYTIRKGVRFHTAPR